MTILPKKKPTTSKTECESSEHQGGHASHSHQHHQATTDARHEKATRSRNSPTRWVPSTAREEKLASHDPGGTFEGHESVNNKRRHRSSPHRTHARKHRMHASATVTSREYQASTEYEETGYNSGDEYVPPQHPDNIEELEAWFEKTLKEKKGWDIKKMGEDGACLFRAVADQVYGDQEMHAAVRKMCVDYMLKNCDYFSQYVTEDFTTYINRKKMENCHGNHVEMQAMSEMFNRPIEVYQYSIDPINTFNCPYKTENEPIRISYHGNVHYNSIVDPFKATIGVGLGLPGLQPGMADKTQMRDAVRQSEDVHIEQTMLEDKLRETDWEVTQETIEEQVARESYLQWLKESENHARKQSSPRSASATCSSSKDNLYKDLGSPELLQQGRSPRTRSNPGSGGNSPQRLDTGRSNPSSPQQGESAGQRSPLPECSGYNASTVSDTLGSLGATGGAQDLMTTNFVETSSLMNCYNSDMYGLSDWMDEDDIMTQVIAQSQKEYLDSLKKSASSSPTPDPSTFS
ncbi:OTU domain-containing protein 5-B-like [Crassostrea angulata]|uniref:ubiquitinyl hydrolase 1 n=1 Tax=Magallana gigas TaxID=29159 RepID=A0A8W8LIK9_MAGGI|nr:OTU domain-containing protein 5-B [Crassostrea gigas]XP_052678620.1 OTU domain-containing protein 5-B-like [Crassostrea angulata]|eukprot:XP_011450657.1 PREDICTED: OTU domain-containing protein 5-B [Crassostrea gigas]